MVRYSTFTARVRVRFLVGELAFHMPCGQKKKKRRRTQEAELGIRKLQCEHDPKIKGNEESWREMSFWEL